MAFCLLEERFLPSANIYFPLIRGSFYILMRVFSWILVTVLMNEILTFFFLIVVSIFFPNVGFANRTEGTRVHFPSSFAASHFG